MKYVRSMKSAKQRGLKIIRRGKKLFAGTGRRKVCQG